MIRAKIVGACTRHSPEGLHGPASFTANCWNTFHLFRRLLPFRLVMVCAQGRHLVMEFPRLSEVTGSSGAGGGAGLCV
jgi:hypothetical protein